MSFRPILPARLPDLARLGEAALVEEDGAAAALRLACSGAPAPAGEVVVWAWVLSAALDKVLLVDHPHFGTLLPPGGRVEPDETVVEAVLRELREETGLDLDSVEDPPALVDRVTGTLDTGAPFQTFGLAFVATADPATPLVGEPGQLPAWFALDDRPARASERHWRRITAHVDRLRA